MASEVLRLTSQIVIAHASMSELTPQELVEEIKEVYQVLSAMEGGAIPEGPVPEKGKEAGLVKKPPAPAANRPMGSPPARSRCSPSSPRG